MRANLDAALRWIDDERGVTAIEYALLASLIAVAILTGVSTYSSALGNVYQTVATKVSAVL